MHTLHKYKPFVIKQHFVFVGFRRSHQRCYVKKSALKNLANITKKHLCWSLFLIKFIKKRLQHGCFPVKATI